MLCKHEVVGSIPSGSTMVYCGLAGGCIDQVVSGLELVRPKDCSLDPDGSLRGFESFAGLMSDDVGLRGIVDIVKREHIRFSCREIVCCV